jgi:hypothetical protein
VPMRREARLRRARSARIRMVLPTSVPGISFLGRGRIWYRPVPHGELHPADSSHPIAAAARAAAFAGMNKTASDITGVLFPEQVFEAEQKVTMALAPWRPTSAYRDVAFRGQLELTLPERDLVRAEEFTEARRAARLDVVLAEDASASLWESHLSDITRARLWWLRQYLSQPGPDLSWKAFDEHVRPLVAEAHRPEDDIDRLARILLTTTDRVGDDPRLLRTLLQIFQRAFEVMDWPDLAAEINDLNHQSSEDRPTPVGQV